MNVSRLSGEERDIRPNLDHLPEPHEGDLLDAAIRIF
jgi:hypothetical protein